MARRKRKANVNKRQGQRSEKKPLGALAEALKSAGVAPEINKRSQHNEQHKKKAVKKRRPLLSQKQRERNQSQQVIENATFTGVDGKRKTLLAGQARKGDTTGGSKSKTEKKAELPTSGDRLRITPKTKVNLELLQADKEHLYPGLLPGKKQNTPVSQSDGEVDLVIGLDFGTTYCKAVVQEPDSGRAWAIPFTDSRENPYLLSTRILQLGSVFCLHGNGESTGNLKMPLLTGVMPRNHANSVIAFFALVIRHIKLWIETHKSDELAGLAPVWFINIGLPARDLESSDMVGNFRKLMWAAMSLAVGSDSEVQKQETDSALISASRALKSGDKTIRSIDGGEVYRDQIGVFPEIAAQIYGYLKSDMWDQSQDMFLLLDVGGGTVDGAIFKVDESDDDGEIKFSFLKSSVEQLGVFVLHQKRLGWYMSQLQNCPGSEKIAGEIQDVIDKDVTPSQVPGAISDYLIQAEYPEKTLDTEFYEQFRRMAWDQLIQSVRKDTYRHSSAWKQLPFLLCGGGRSIKLYNEFLKLINRPEDSSAVTLREIVMRKPDSLEGAGLGESEYQRISVAYGLSFHEIGKVLTPDKFSKPVAQSLHTDLRKNYISPEMV